MCLNVFVCFVYGCVCFCCVCLLCVCGCLRVYVVCVRCGLRFLLFVCLRVRVCVRYCICVSVCACCDVGFVLVCMCVCVKLNVFVCNV